jgi:hypothetical protein
MTTATGLDALTRAERLQLLRFVISFAWADLSVSLTERAFVHRLVTRLRLHPDELRQVEGWLSLPPAPDSVDPGSVPREHRRLFLETVRRLAQVDGEISPEEKESLALLDQLTR